MPKEKKALKTLLLQVREDPRVRVEEHQSFVDYSGLETGQIDILNVFDTPSFEPEIIDAYDALFVGGSSAASVLEPETYSFLQPSYALLPYCIKKQIPVFASCFGFQLAVIALGGDITRNSGAFEMGTMPISLSKDAASDPVFKNTTDGFLAISVHREKATALPKGCRLLAYTEECVHSFKVEDSPFWAFQFHPEVDRARLVERLTIYREKYTEDPEHLDKVLSSAKETPESNALVASFVNNVLAT